jgi:hypothetical protein
MKRKHTGAIIKNIKARNLLLSTKKNLIFFRSKRSLGTLPQPNTLLLLRE